MRLSRLFVPQMINKVVEHDPDPPAGMQFSVGDQPNREVDFR
jgi:hypothetical protein